MACVNVRAAIYQPNSYRQLRIHSPSSIGGIGRIFSVQLVEWRASLTGVRKSVRGYWLDDDRPVAGRNGFHVRPDGTVEDCQLIVN